VGQKYCRVLSGTFSRFILELKKSSSGIIYPHLSSHYLDFTFKSTRFQSINRLLSKLFGFQTAFNLVRIVKIFSGLIFYPNKQQSAKKNPSHVRYQHTTDLLAAPNRREKSRRPNPEPYTRSRFHKNTLLTFTVIHSLDVIHASSSSAPVASSPTFAAMPKPTSQNSPRPTYCS